MGTTAVIAAFLSRLLDVDANMVLALTALVAGDFVTGVWRAWKNGGWETITSHGLRRTFDKVARYSITILVAMAIGNICGHSEKVPEFVRTQLLYLPTFAFVCVIIVEGGSILENIFDKPVGLLLPALFSWLRLIGKARHEIGDAVRDKGAEGAHAEDAHKDNHGYD